MNGTVPTFWAQTNVENVELEYGRFSSGTWVKRLLIFFFRWIAKAIELN